MGYARLIAPNSSLVIAFRPFLAFVSATENSVSPRAHREVSDVLLETGSSPSRLTSFTISNFVSALTGDSFDMTACLARSSSPLETTTQSLELLVSAYTRNSS